MKAFIQYTEQEKKEYVYNAWEICRVIEGFGLKTHLIFGALLGAVREGKLIDSDTDIDLAYISNESEPKKIILEARDLFNNIKKHLTIWRYFDHMGKRHSVNDIINPCGQIFIKTKSKDLPFPVVDLKASWIKDGDYWNCIWGYLFKYNGLKQIDFYGCKFNIPESPQLLLSKVYGDDWMTPRQTKAIHRLKHKPVLYNLTHGH
jgi:hypothetical protein